MRSIPVSFTYQDKTYSGTLQAVAGAGDTGVWHLMIDKYYWGRLRVANGQWVFDPTPQDPELAGYAEYFGRVVAPTFQTGREADGGE